MRVTITSVARKRKPAFGKVDGKNYAVQINALPSNDFFKQPWGRQLDDWAKIKEFQKKAKTYHVDAKGKATMSAVKAWVKAEKPSEFFANWKADSSSWKDDSVKVFYVK